MNYNAHKLRVKTIIVFVKTWKYIKYCKESNKIRQVKLNFTQTIIIKLLIFKGICVVIDPSGILFTNCTTCR